VNSDVRKYGTRITTMMLNGMLEVGKYRLINSEIKSSKIFDGIKRNRKQISLLVSIMICNSVMSMGFADTIIRFIGMYHCDIIKTSSQRNVRGR